MRYPIRKKIRKKMNRSGYCKCDICSSSEILTGHHIEGRDIPNANHPSNLANLCPNCHAAVHYGKIIIEKWITSTRGKELLWHSVGEASFSGQDSKSYVISFQQ